MFCWYVTASIASDTALAGRPGVSPHAAAASSVPKELMKEAVIPMHSISPTLYVKGLTYQHILSVDMFTKEQVQYVNFHLLHLARYKLTLPYLCITGI